MEVRIIGKPFATAKFNLTKFKSILKENLDLEDAVKRSTEIIQVTEPYTQQQFITLLQLGMDWSEIISVLKHSNQEEMEVKGYECEHKGWMRMKEGTFSSDGRKFILPEYTQDEKDLILTNSFIKSPLFVIRTFLRAGQFKYGQKQDWKIEVNY